MTTEEILDVLYQYFPQLALYTWIPSVITIGIVIFMILKGVNDFKRTMAQYQDNDEVKALRKQINEQNNQIRTLKELSVSQTRDYNEVIKKLNKVVEEKTHVQEGD